MAGSNILTRKQFEKMTNDQLIEFVIKLLNNMISKETELINDSKEFRENLVLVTLNLTSLKRKMKFSRVNYQWQKKSRRLSSRITKILMRKS